MHENIKDLANQRFGRLVVICSAKHRSKGGDVIWLCRCDCGNLTEARGCDLVRKHTKSCGCLQKERAREVNSRLNLKHGDAIHGRKLRLYRTWGSMKQRCLNPNDPDYKYYGGKRIKVCDEWLNSYQAFKFWAFLSGYADNLVIDRTDNNKGYSPSNCQWITASENSKKSWRERRKE